MRRKIQPVTQIGRLQVFFLRMFDWSTLRLEKCSLVLVLKTKIQSISCSSTVVPET